LQAPLIRGPVLADVPAFFPPTFSKTPTRKPTARLKP
jgi:hypothetical protein